MRPDQCGSRLVLRVFLWVVWFSSLHKKPKSPNSNSETTIADPHDKTAKADVALSLINIDLILFNSKTRVYYRLSLCSTFFLH